MNNAMYVILRDLTNIVVESCVPRTSCETAPTIKSGNLLTCNFHCQQDLYYIR